MLEAEHFGDCDLRQSADNSLNACDKVLERKLTDCQMDLNVTMQTPVGLQSRCDIFLTLSQIVERFGVC